jgi:hypothetical protein
VRGALRPGLRGPETLGFFRIAADAGSPQRVEAARAETERRQSEQTDPAIRDRQCQQRRGVADRRHNADAGDHIASAFRNVSTRSDQVQPAGSGWNPTVFPFI